MTVFRLRTRLLAPFAWLSQTRDGDILGRERGQALLRVVVSGVAAVYLIYAHPFDSRGEGLPPWLVIASYAIFSIGIFWRILHARNSPEWRRYLTNAGDMSVVSYTMIASGEPAMPLFLECDVHVPTPLEPTYQATWAVCPKPLKELLEPTSR